MKMYNDSKLANETIFETTFMDSWILLERHFPKICNCSYCQDKNLEIKTIKRLWDLSLWLPPCRASNSWRVISWKKNDAYYFLRWTLPKWSWFGEYNKWSNGWRFISMPFGKNTPFHSLLSISKNSLCSTKIKIIFDLESIFWISLEKREPYSKTKDGICAVQKNDTK